MTQRHYVQSDHASLITTNIAERASVFLNPAFAREAVDTLYRVQERHPFFLFGFVIMPDHCHFLLRTTYPQTTAHIMNIFKSGLTFNIGIPKMWQRRYHLLIPSRPDLALDYIHENPVKAGMVDVPEKYPWSSACGKWNITPLEE